MADSKVIIQRDTSVEPEEVVALRTAVGGFADSAETWDACIRQALCVVSAREVETNRLVGIGFLVGNKRHAQLVDMTVHPEFQRRGIGRKLQAERLAFANESDIRYVGLTWDKTFPWLHDFYQSNGFRDVDFAMWHESSLTKDNPPK